MDSLLN